MNYLKLIWDLIVVCGGAFLITCGLLIAYRVAVADAPLQDILSQSTFTLMWASTVFGMLAGKYR